MNDEGFDRLAGPLRAGLRPRLRRKNPVHGVRRPMLLHRQADFPPKLSRPACGLHRSFDGLLAHISGVNTRLWRPGAARGSGCCRRGRFLPRELRAVYGPQSRGSPGRRLVPSSRPFFPSGRRRGGLVCPGASFFTFLAWLSGLRRRAIPPETVGVAPGFGNVP